MTFPPLPDALATWKVTKNAPRSNVFSFLMLHQSLKSMPILFALCLDDGFFVQLLIFLAFLIAFFVLFVKRIMCLHQILKTTQLGIHLLVADIACY